MKKLMLVGAGMAGMRFLEQLLVHAPGQYLVEVFNAEPLHTRVRQGKTPCSYNRIMLSPVLAGEKTFDSIVTHDQAWFEARGMVFHSGKTVSHLDGAAKRLTTFCGETHFYDVLVMATGSKPLMLDIKGRDLPGLVSFREVSDVDRMLYWVNVKGSNPPKVPKAVVIGGGLLGLEAAYGLVKQGVAVTVVHRNAKLMSQQMDASAAGLLKTHLENPALVGMQFKLAANVVEVLGTQQVTGVRLDSGEELAADLVVMAIGIQPNAELASASGLTVERGVVVNDQLATSQAPIYALGECVQHRGQTYGLVAPLYQQAEVLAKVLGGVCAEDGNAATYVGSNVATQLKITGVNVFSAGDFEGQPGTHSVVFRDWARQVYRKLVFKNQRLVGALLMGDTRDANGLFELICTPNDLSQSQDNLIFGLEI